eukprot:Skav209420  [mRNA]  locus=scaffold1411:337164:354193:+ [translate_table: standard]
MQCPYTTTAMPLCGLDRRRLVVPTAQRAPRRGRCRKGSLRAIVFVATKRGCQQLERSLRGGEGRVPLSIDAIHGDRSQRDREAALGRFREGATQDVNLVVNFDMPRSAEDYVHRIGRTGRNNKGVAVSILTEPWLDRIGVGHGVCMTIGWENRSGVTPNLCSPLKAGKQLEELGTRMPPELLKRLPGGPPVPPSGPSAGGGPVDPRMHWLEPWKGLDGGNYNKEDLKLGIVTVTEPDTCGARTAGSSQRTQNMREVAGGQGDWAAVVGPQWLRFGKVAYWNWNLAPQTDQVGGKNVPEYLTSDFLFTPEQWGAGEVMEKYLRPAGQTNFLDSNGQPCPAQMANILLGTNEPDIYGSCMGNMFGKCRSHCETPTDCPVARLDLTSTAEPNSRGECNCWQYSHATGAGFWPLQGCSR